MRQKLPGIIILLLVVLFGGYSLWQYGIEAAATVGSDRPSFQADLKNTIDLQAGVGKPTFTRATIATVTDFEGLIKTVKSGEARFEGARRVENLLTFSEDFSNALWAVSVSGTGITATKTPNYGTAPDGTLTAVRIVLDKGAGTTVSDYAGLSYNETLVSGLTGLSSVWIKTTDGSSKVVAIQNSTGLAVVTVTGVWQRMSTGSATANIFTIRLRGTYGTSDTADLQIWHPMFENTAGQSNQNPSEYVSTNVNPPPYHGANVDGVKYFTTYNGNTVSSNVVTETVGAAIPDATLHGYVAEGARTNVVLRSAEFDNASWIKQNMATSPTADVAVAPSGATTADRVTFDANASSQMYNSASLPAGTYTLSVYAKTDSVPKSFLLTIYNATDGIQSSSPITTTSSWVRYSATFTVTAASNVYIRNNAAGNSGTAFFWGYQAELASFASSYIPTTSASVTRNKDMLSYPISNFSNTAGSIYAEVIHYGWLEYGRIIGGTNTTVTPLSLDTNGVNFGLFEGVNHPTVLKSGTGLQKVGSKWSIGSTKVFANQTASAQTGYVGTFGMSDVAIGTTNGGTGSNTLWYGTIRNVKIWKKALTDAQLQNITNTNSVVSQSAVRKTTVGTSQNTKLTTGLIGLWSFNSADMSGITAYDRSGQGNNGYFIGGATSSAKTIGKVGQALGLNGTSNYVDVGDINAMDSAAQLTISAWTYFTALRNYDSIISKSTNAALNDRVILSLGGPSMGDSTSVAFSLGNGSNSYGYTATGVISKGVWIHWVGVFDGTQTGDSNRMKLYINGVNQSLTFSGTIPATTASTAYTTKIGWEQQTRYLSGKIDEVRIYNRALSASEVTQLYQAGTANVNTAQNTKFTDGVVGLWSFNGPDISGVTAYDRSGQGNNGTTTGGVTKATGKVGQALQFDGTSGYVNVGDPANEVLDFGTGSFTLSSWIKNSRSMSNSSVWYPIVKKKNTFNADNAGFQLWLRGGSENGFNFRLNDGSMVSGNDIVINPTTSQNTPLSDGAWHHIVAVVDRSSTIATLFIDGSSVGSESISLLDGSINNVESLTIGKDLATYFPGKIDEVRIYNRALSSSEVAQLYNLGR